MPSVRQTIFQLENNGHDVDVFIAYYNTKYGYHPYIKGMLGFDTDEYIATHNFNIDISNVVDVTHGLSDVVDTTNFDKNMKEIYHGYSQYNIFSICLDMMEKYEKVNNVTYDVIIKSRMDVMISPSTLVSCVENIDRNYVYLNNKETTFPADHIFIACRNDIINLPNFVKQMYIKPDSYKCWEQPPHGVLLYWLTITHKHIIQSPLCNIIRWNTDCNNK
jgi:hypothetical protein